MVSRVLHPVCWLLLIGLSISGIVPHATATGQANGQVVDHRYPAFTADPTLNGASANQVITSTPAHPAQTPAQTVVWRLHLPIVMLEWGTVIVQPVEDTESIYANPGMGWQTFGRVAGRDSNLAGLPTTTVYHRFSWNDLEPEEGQFNFALFDRWLQNAGANGQRLAWRLMVAASNQSAGVPPLLGYAPLWLRDKGASGYIYYRDHNENGRQDQESEPDIWAPDLADPIARFYHDRLVQELGRRYDGHPFLDMLDIGSVGLWGEWHFYAAVVKEVVGNPPSGQTQRGWVAMPSASARQSIIDTWVNAFPNTPKAILIGDSTGMQYATGTHRTGWRADCWGDMNWHMPRFYDRQIQATSATEAWRNGPVALEPCWNMQYWYDQGWNGNDILDWAVSRHASYIQNKSRPIPAEWLPAVQRALRAIGYRLVLREIQHPVATPLGVAVAITTIWDNTGNAPPYWDYDIKVRLKRAGVEWVSPPLRSVKGWQPGSRIEPIELTLPPDLPPGEYELAIGVFSRFPEHTHPNLKYIKLAIQTAPDGDGWYPLSRVTLK
ncbi:DUF4832 domain-containing protein [Chloroflexus sp.]|uniref:DUF4832 domain-containing protein n=1 Tax=Chloroflexus sp. TaxID=1904827 RepID=UPI0026262366|nr:DUF4832 domain-containing protein [uncultured Chloroflexus sp.]